MSAIGQDITDPCVHYEISTSTGAAVCRLHHNLMPDPCPCSQYSADYGTHGPRRNRWSQHLMWDSPHDLNSTMTP
jgi:hypothetical protein